MFTVKRNDQIGRYAVASSDMKSGEVILVETPFAFGPKSDSPPLCLGCLAPVDCTTLCTECFWPLCSLQCKSFQTHQENECRVFAEAKAKFQIIDFDASEVSLQYECISPLRVLLAKEKHPKRWNEEVEMMEAHIEIRKTTPIWRFNQINIVEYLRGPCKLSQFSEDLIHFVCGILDVNSFEARSSSGFLIRCLYPKLGMFSHNCVSNIHHSISPNDFKVTVRTAVDIQKDKELFCSYTYSLWPTLIRREFLKESKYFECKCQRCQDKTELGTHLGSLKCKKCESGIILSTDPLSFTCEWKCTECSFTTYAESIRSIYDMVQREIDRVDKINGIVGLQCREAIHQKFENVLHPQNAYLIILKASISEALANKTKHNDKSLQEKNVELCRQVLEVLDTIEPGLTRIRGVVMYNLQNSLINLTKNEFSLGVINDNDFSKRMKEGINYLEESIKILGNEEVDTDEGKLGMLAQRSYVLLNNLVK